MGPSKCLMYDVSEEDLSAFMTRNVEEAWPNISCSAVANWTYDQR